MPNSTISLQDVVDVVMATGDLAPVLPTGGFATKVALAIANDVMTDLIAQRFNWKWNRIVVPPFLTNSYQQDYAAVNIQNLGWLEHGILVDINSTMQPKPIVWLECVRDLERSSVQFGTPGKACWLPNDQMVQDVWPGASKAITSPTGLPAMPSNPIINIVDANGNILVLTTYGVTGLAAPLLAAASAAGTTVTDGSCVWTVANPKGAGFRLFPVVAQTGVVWQVYLIAQARPARFTTMGQLLEPVPDDFETYFRSGFKARAYEYSPNPAFKKEFPQRRLAWLADMMQSRTQGDREKEDAAFVPDRTFLQGGTVAWPYGPAWPFPPPIS